MDTDRVLQHRDIADPIRRIVREHLDNLEVAAIHHGPIIADLTEMVNDVVDRAMREAWDDGRRHAAAAVRAYAAGLGGNDTGTIGVEAAAFVAAQGSGQP